MSDTESLTKLRNGSSHKKVIIFIHGIGAKDPEEYWKQFTEVLLKDTNAFIKNFDVYVWGYPTHKGPNWLINLISSLNNRTLVDTAPSIEQLGGLWQSTYEAQLRKYQEVVLVCHSMGGLLVQSWIIDTLIAGQSIELAHLRHITFYSTPHNGAPIAGTALNDQLEGMTVNSSFVGRTRRLWNDRVVKWMNVQMRLEDRLYNHFIPHLVLSGVGDLVVPRNFAEIVGMPCKNVDGNHATLIQPTSIQDTRYIIWRNELEKALSYTIEAKEEVDASQQAPKQDNVKNIISPQEANLSASPIPSNQSSKQAVQTRKANVLDQTLHHATIRALEGIPVTATLQGRTALLIGLPRNIISGLHRDSSSDANDLENILSQLDGLGPLETGEQPLIIFMQNASRRAEGLAVSKSLNDVLEELKHRYGLS